MGDFAILGAGYTVSWIAGSRLWKLTIFAILHNLLIKLDSLHTSITRDLPISRRTKILIIILLTRTSRYRFRTNWYTFTILSNKVEVTATSASSVGDTYHS
jgi:hypothetical protein